MTLRWKAVLLVLSLMLTADVLVTAVSWRLVGSMLEDDIREDTRAFAESAEPRLRALLASRRERPLLDALGELKRDKHAVYAAALDAQGRQLAHTDVERAAAPGAAPLLEVAVPVWAPVARVDDDSEGFLMGGSRRAPDSRIGELRLAVPLAHARRARDGIALRVMFVVLFSGIFAAAIILVAAGGVRARLERQLEAVGRIGSGRYEPFGDAQPPDELGALARGIDAMAAELKRTTVSKDELAARNALLLAQQETSLDGILVVDEQGRIQSCNRRFIEMWGIPQDVLDSRSDELALQSVLSKLEDPPAFLARVEHLYSHPEETSQDEIVLLDGRSFDRYSSPVAAGGRYLGRVWYFRDVTDRKQAEEANALREKDLILREFVANVSHELRTPITAIKGFAETLLLGALEDRENRRGFVVTIERNADRLARLVDNLLALSVLDSGRRGMLLEDVELARFVRDFARTLEPLALRARVSLRLDVSGELRVLADPGQLSQVLQNLIDNAIKFSRPGGMVDVGGAPHEDGQSASIWVRDSGIGIPAVDLPRVFERFHRADGRAREVKGTGLGLSIAKQIVELHGGRIWAESVEGSGATFRFTLKLAGASAGRPVPSGQNALK